MRVQPYLRVVFKSCLLLVGGSLLAVPGTRAGDVSTSGSIDRGQCPTWSWAEQERIPVFDPLASPDSDESTQRIQALDAQIRRMVEESIARRGWRKAAQGACQLSYSLIQELDLDVARYDTGGMVPGNIVDSGGGLGAAKADSYLRKRGDFTLDVSSGDPAARLWRGTLASSLGQGKDGEKNSLKLAREVAGTIPKQ